MSTETAAREREQRKQERARDSLHAAADAIMASEAAKARSLLLQAEHHLGSIGGGWVAALPAAPAGPAPDRPLSGQRSLMYQRAQRRAAEAADDAASLAALGRIAEALDTLGESRHDVDTMESRATA